MRFANREDAGRKLAHLLTSYAHEKPVVLGLPRGGVPVAYEIATALNAPLDVWIVRKVGAPDFPELGLGAVAEGGVVYLDRAAVRETGASDEELEQLVQRKSAEVAERIRRYRGNARPPQLEGRTVILVDDGIATGGTVRAALESLREAKPKKIVLAVPIAASQSLAKLSTLVDEVVCLRASPSLYAIGVWYEDFAQVEDEEVVALLARSRGIASGRDGVPAEAVDPQEVTIPIAGAELRGTLAGPEAPLGLVLFAHGTGSSRHSPRNRYVASELNRRGLATLLFDLLTEEEEAVDQYSGALRFDIELLAQRLIRATDWVKEQPAISGLPVGYFGASSGAAAALVAAAERPEGVHAVVSRGGRPDLARASLEDVRAPTLLIVGGHDHPVLELNEHAWERLRCEKRLEIVPGATHLFEEPGTLEVVARLSAEWFAAHLGDVTRGTGAPPPEAPQPASAEPRWPPRAASPTGSGVR